MKAWTEFAYISVQATTWADEDRRRVAAIRWGMVWNI